MMDGDGLRYESAETATILSTVPRLSISDWSPLLVPRHRSGLLLAFYPDDSADGKREVVFVAAGFVGGSMEQAVVFDSCHRLLVTLKVQHR
jgi:hypothetical protein